MSTITRAPEQAERLAIAEARRDNDGGASRPPDNDTAATTLTHDYRTWMTVPGGRASCRIRIYQVGALTIGIATRRQDKFGGTALTSNTAALATRVERWHHPPRDGNFAWIEHYEFPNGDGPRGARETFTEVVFARADDGSPTRPGWFPTDRAAVEARIGRAVGA